MDHHDALAYIASLESFGIRPGLDRIRTLLSRLGDPQREFPSVVIAGTNGKGSVAATLASILREAGIPAGVYTSPHLNRFEERIVIAGEPIEPADLASLTSEVAAAIEAGRLSDAPQPTYFEATTALAFLQFSRRKVPLAILEVGMGGRYDATNVVTPLASAITPIAIDHARWLGESLPEIALQKAGILKPRVPAVVARQESAALRVIRDEAQRVGTPLIERAHCSIDPPAGQDRPQDPPVFALSTPSGRRYDRLSLSLRGEHQVENAAVAVMLAEILAAERYASIDAEAISRGLRRTCWPGRIEIAAGEPDLLLDGAHNPDGCRALVSYLKAHQPRRRLALVFAALKDKPAAEMLRILSPGMSEVFLTSLPVQRAEPPGAVQRVAQEAGVRAAVAPAIEDALTRARRSAGTGGLAVVCGSLYLVGEVRRILGLA